MKTYVLGAIAALAAFGVAGKANAQEEPYCREYQQRITVGGVVRNSYGTACMQPDGSWQVQGGDADLAAQDLAKQESVQMANVDTYSAYEPAPVVYTEPVYTSYQYYPGINWGLNLGWSDHDGWHGGRGWNGGGWHGRH